MKRGTACAHAMVSVRAVRACSAAVLQRSEEFYRYATLSLLEKLSCQFCHQKLQYMNEAPKPIHNFRDDSFSVALYTEHTLK